MTITPDPQDYASVEREHGRLPVNASDLQCAEHYRLAQATKLIRLWEQGKLPLPKMRAMDRLKRAAVKSKGPPPGGLLLPAGRSFAPACQSLDFLTFGDSLDGCRQALKAGND